MATLKSTRYRNQSNLGDRLAGVHTPVVPFTFSAAIAASDVAKIQKLPKEVTLVSPGSWFVETSADFDTSTNLTFSLVVTDGTTTKTIISGSTIGQGAAARALADTTAMGWLGFETDNDSYEVRLLFPAGPSTATSGTFTVGFAYSTQRTNR